MSKEHKNTIENFIKFFIYDLKQGNNTKTYIENAEYDLNRFLKPYIDEKHYNFNPFKEVI